MPHCPCAARPPREHNGHAYNATEDEGCFMYQRDAQAAPGGYGHGAQMHTGIAGIGGP